MLADMSPGDDKYADVRRRTIAKVGFFDTDVPVAKEVPPADPALQASFGADDLIPLAGGSPKRSAEARALGLASSPFFVPLPPAEGEPEPTLTVQTIFSHGKISLTTLLSSIMDRCQKRQTGTPRTRVSLAMPERRAGRWSRFRRGRSTRVSRKFGVAFSR